MKLVSVRREATLEIVSSGYDDRYVSQSSYLILEVDYIRYRIDSDNHYISAYLNLAGMKDSEKNVKKVIEVINSSKFNQYIYYDGTMVKSTYNRIDAGLQLALGFPHQGQTGIEKTIGIAETLSNAEWDAIRYGLNRVNDDHVRRGKPVVEFTIPSKYRS